METKKVIILLLTSILITALIVSFINKSNDGIDIGKISKLNLEIKNKNKEITELKNKLRASINKDIDKPIDVNKNDTPIDSAGVIDNSEDQQYHLIARKFIDNLYNYNSDNYKEKMKELLDVATEELVATTVGDVNNLPDHQQRIESSITDYKAFQSITSVNNDSTVTLLVMGNVEVTVGDGEPMEQEQAFLIKVDKGIKKVNDFATVEGINIIRGE